MIDHALAFEHLGNHQAGAVFARCHSVVGRPGGTTPDMAKWISDSASTVSPLQASTWCTLPTKKSMHCSPLDDGEVGGRGRPGEEGGVEGAGGGADRDRLGGVCEEGLGSTPLPLPHPPNRPLPHPQHLVHAAEVPAPRMSIARLVAPPAPTNYLVGGYWGAVKSGRPSMASQEIDFDDALRKAATVIFQDMGRNGRQSLFFLCADGKAQVLMAGCQNWKAQSPGATVVGSACVTVPCAFLPLAQQVR